MKRKTAREILAESFRELAGSKPVDRITVPEIIENCGYSKTTFYRLFKDKYDLMAWDYGQMKKLSAEAGIPLSTREFHCKGSFKALHKGRPNAEDLKAVRAFARDVVA